MQVVGNTLTSKDLKRDAEPSEAFGSMNPLKHPKNKRVPNRATSCTSDFTNNHKRQKFNYKDIQECPTYNLTAEDMLGDPLTLFKRLEIEYEAFGGIKLKVNEQWNPPFSLKYIDKKLTTRIQNIHELRNGKAFEQKIGAYGMKEFEQVALGFQQKYNYVTSPQGSTKEEKNQSEFWSLVSKPEFDAHNIKVEYAADLPVSKYGSGFPLVQHTNVPGAHFNYHKNLYNINNLYKSPQSLLRIIKNKSDRISGVTSPWVYVGMMFSSFCWHVEDLYINSLNYNHQGATKTWYMVPRRDKEKFDEFVKIKLGKVFDSKPDILHRITLMIDPLDLMRQGITVHKINQQERCYVLTFGKVYHGGFCHGFTVGEAVNFVTTLSVPDIKEATFIYKGLKGKKTGVFPLEWLILENCQQEELKELSQEDQRLLLKERDQIIAIESEALSRVIKEVGIEGLRYMDVKNLRYDKNVCSLCKAYCYLSHLQCQGCLSKYCLEERPQCCQNYFVVVLRKPSKQRLHVVQMLQENNIFYRDTQQPA